MKCRKNQMVILRLDDRRYAVAVNDIVRYVGTKEECQRRIKIMEPKDDRAAQNEALGRLGRVMG